jgi:L-amino acid N-acyltransferase YncA
MMTIRRATAGDSADLLEWRNDEQTRAASISGQVVTQGEHDAWFARSLAASDRSIYLAVDEASRTSVGMCRFDVEEARVEISINLNPLWRGKGVAREVLAAAIDHFRADDARRMPLVATIRGSNKPSARIFVSCGFELVDSENGLDSYRRVL